MSRCNEHGVTGNPKSGDDILDDALQRIDVHPGGLSTRLVRAQMVERTQVALHGRIVGSLQDGLVHGFSNFLTGKAGHRIGQGIPQHVLSSAKQLESRLMRAFHLHEVKPLLIHKGPGLLEIVHDSSRHVDRGHYSAKLVYDVIHGE